MMTTAEYRRLMAERSDMMMLRASPALARGGRPHDKAEGAGPWASTVNLFRSVFGRIEKLQAAIEKMETEHRTETAALTARIDSLFAATKQ
jgi:hypothetical protein